MLFTISKTAEVLAAAGKPADLFFRIFSTEITFGGSDLPILHQIFFGGKLLGYKLGITIEDHVDLFPSGLRTAEIVDGIKMMKRLIVKEL